MRLLEDSLAEAILAARIEDGSNAIVDLDRDGSVTVMPIQQKVFQFVAQ
jgi:hypothetical protein